MGGSYYDPAGLALTETGSGTPSSPVVYTYPGPGGANETITVNYASDYVSADFGCYTGYAGYVNLPSSIVYPDGSAYTLQYDSAGRLTSLKLPSGGTITYGHSLSCSSGNVNTSLTQTDPDGGVWSWAHTAASNQTVQTDPYGNTTVTDFDAYGEPTEVDVWQGNYANGGTELKKTTITNGGTTTWTTEVLGPTDLYLQSTQTLDGELLTGETASNWYTSGTPPLLTQQINTWTASGNGEVLTSAVTKDGSGNIASETTYGSFVNGNPETVTQYVSAGTYLTTDYTYNPNGSIASETGPNGATTTFSSFTCGFFPQSVTNSIGTVSLTWDCGGALPTQVRGYNGNATTIAYDSRWRQTSVTAPDGAVTTTTYTPTSVETAMPFNYNGGTPYSTDDVLTTFDGMGRPELVQRRQGPGSSSFDTVETCYDEMGRATFVSEAYTGAAGQTESCASPGTTTAYDALSRPTLVANADGGTTSYTYTMNDTGIAVGPAPAGENAKRKQEEFDGLGRLSSVCEVTSAGGSAVCEQNTNAYTGYLTEYTRNALGEITNVSENAEGTPTESRSFTFDWLGRMTSETNPESGTTNFTFDTDPACGSSRGDLVKRVDASGNVTCYAYDAAHQVTQISYPSGPNAGVTPTKTFVYDSDSGLGVAGAPGYPASSLIGRLVEAYTGPVSAPAAIVGYAYDGAGRPDYTAEETANSGGWLTATESYHRGGAVAAIAAEGAPQMNYGLDGEGRAVTALDANGYHDVSAGSYSALGLTSLTLGTGDSDAYSYDAATGAMTGYQFTVNGQTDSGTLGWHRDGEAKSFLIADGIAGATDNGVSCTYTHDDLGRLSEANCGSGDDERYAWDPFGNHNTTAGPSQLVTDFSFTSGNQYSASTGGDYDSDGNLLQDPLNAGVANAFDAEGQPVDLLGATVTYDALGREVEAGVGGSWGPDQILYAPDGTKLGLMNGGSAYGIDYPLPGGGGAVYNASGLQFFRHAGALGSAALTTNLSRALLSSDYYAPFGFDESGAGAGCRSFTGQKQDSDSLHSGGQYDFLRREYDPIQGRWWTPDPAGAAAVDPNNPQTWNEYAYVAGMPLEVTDPQGLHLADCGYSGGMFTCVTNSAPGCGWSNGWCGGGGPGWGMGGPTFFQPDLPGGNRPAGGGGDPWALGPPGPTGPALPGTAPPQAQHSMWQCLGQSAAKNGVALAIDTASLAVDAVGPEGQYAKLAVGLALSTAATIDSAANQDAAGTVLGTASYNRAALDFAANSAEWGWGKWIPFAGVGLDVGALVHDGLGTYADYSACMAQP